MNHFDTTILSRLLEPALSLRLTLTLLHFLWQGVLLGLVALAADLALRRATSRVRYAMFVGILAMMGAALPATFSLVRVGEEQQRIPLVTAPPSPAFVATTPSRPANPRPAAFPSPIAAAPRRDPAMDDPELADALTAAPSIAQPVPRRGLESYAAPIAVAYLVGIGLMLARLAVALQGGRRLRLAAMPISEGPITELARRQAKQIGLKSAPLVAWCGRISVPVVVGIVRPMILLPSALATGFEPSQLEALLTHELAHIRRFDPLVNLLQRLIEVALFFHPAVWYVSRRVSAERENACDDLVVSAGWPAVRYAQALLQMAEFCAAARGISPQSSATLAASGGGASQFKRRVVRLLEIEDAPRVRISRGSVLLMAAVSLFAFAAPTIFRAAAGENFHAAAAEEKAPSAAEPIEKASAPQISPTVERIFAAWKARQRRVKSFHFTWDTRMVLPKGYEFPNQPVLAGLRTWQAEADSDKSLQFTIPQSEWWGEGDDRFRSDLSNVMYVGATGWKQTGRTRLIDNGQLHSRLDLTFSPEMANWMSVWRNISIKNPSTMSSSGSMILHERWLELSPLRLSLRPTLGPYFDSQRFADKTLAWSPEDSRVVSENSIIGNVHCIKLQRNNEYASETCWVDPKRDYVVVLWERQQGPAPARSVAIDYRQGSSQVWLPSSWRWEIAGSSGLAPATFEAKVTKSSINEQFPDHPFADSAPAGTQIYDATVERPIPADWNPSRVEEPANAGQVRDAIVAAWSQRQSRIKTFKFAWKRHGGDRANTVHSLCVDGERYAMAYSTPNWATTRPQARPRNDTERNVQRFYDVYDFRYVFDGKTSQRLSFSERDEGDNSSNALVTLSFGREDGEYPGNRQLMLIFRPFDPRRSRPLDLSKFKVAKERETIDGTASVVIETEDLQRRFHETYWLDPAREYIVLRYHRTLNGRDTDRVDFDYRADPKYGPVPVAWKDASIGMGGALFGYIDTVTDYSINQPIPDAEFKIEIPKGAQVNDMRKKGG
jgi:beta-lactamase regulating signal transducer with metallopeptidase domain